MYGDRIPPQGARTDPLSPLPGPGYNLDMTLETSIETLGWREWVALPELGIPGVKAKLDTGARTSALHAYFVEPFEENGVAKVRFGIHPLRRRPEIEQICVADVKDRRMVSDSGGHREKRYVIETTIRMKDRSWRAEITLTDREGMLFRMLLGRTALAGRFSVDPARSYVAGRSLARSYPRRKKSGVLQAVVSERGV